MGEKSMKVCFIMYPWERVDPETDTTLRMIHECVSRDFFIAITTPNRLSIRESVTSAFCGVIAKTKISKNIPTFYRNVQFKKHMLPLAGFDAIFMRANPPLDTLALNFLDSVRSDTFIINDINGLRIANNKLYTASFQEDARAFIPNSFVSKKRDYLARVLTESPDERMIMKPLAGYGGRGVIVLEKSARHNVSSLLDFYIGEGNNTNYVILQEYVRGAENGDVRILMLNGEPIGAMRRIPAKNEIRSNVHAGGSVAKHVLTKQEKLLCRAVGPKLVRDGIYFAGLDVIGDKLIEVNVLSPGGIARINKLNRVHLQAKVIDFVEHVVSAKDMLISRKDSFRKAIEDADVI
jgi:glutathione synthase